MLRVGHGLVRQACCLKALAKLHTLDATEVGVDDFCVAHVMCDPYDSDDSPRGVYACRGGGEGECVCQRAIHRCDPCEERVQEMLCNMLLSQV